MFHPNHRTTLIIFACLILAFGPELVCRAQSNAVAPALQEKAITTLRAAMKEGVDFEKVHAAEALLWSGHPEGVKEFFEQEEITNLKPPYRIGIWRVLYRTNPDNPTVRQKCLDKIVSVYLDPKAEDHGTAGETLGKIKYAGAELADRVLNMAEHGNDDVRVWSQFILANSGKPEDEARLAESLRSKNPKDREFAAYAVRHFAALRPSTLEAIQVINRFDSAAPKAHCNVLGALYTHLPVDQSDRREAVKQELLKYTATSNTDQRFQACMALANWPTADMIPVVEKLLENKPVDERIGGAYVILRMGQPRDKADPNH